MAEVLTFYEGSAWLYTGNASSNAAYVRNVQVTLAVGRESYRPPQGATWTYIETGREATLSITQARGARDWLTLHQNATGGAVIAHIKSVAPVVSASGGVWLFTGEITTVSENQADGSPENSLAVQATFKNWSAY